MIPLRFPWVWWTLGWLLVAGVAAGSLVPGNTIGDVSVSDKVLHALAYFVLMFWFAGLCRRERHWIPALAIFVFGFALELAQVATSSRSFDLNDAVANASGILLALALAWFVFEGWCRRVEQILFS